MPTASDNNLHSGSSAVNAMLAFENPFLGLHSTRRDIHLPAGKLVSVVASLAHNNPDPEQPDQFFILDLIEASLHYPMYYEYYIQNFTRNRLQNSLHRGQEVCLSFFNYL